MFNNIKYWNGIQYIQSSTIITTINFSSFSSSRKEYSKAKHLIPKLTCYSPLNPSVYIVPLTLGNHRSSSFFLLQSNTYKCPFSCNKSPGQGNKQWPWTIHYQQLSNTYSFGHSKSFSSHLDRFFPDLRVFCFYFCFKEESICSLRCKLNSSLCFDSSSFLEARWKHYSFMILSKDHSHQAFARPLNNPNTSLNSP